MNLKKFYSSIKTIASVGASTNKDHDSYSVTKYLSQQGYKIIPVNPKITQVHGQKAYPDLLSIPKKIKIDVAQIFRRPEHVLPHVEEAIGRGDAKYIWMQIGIVNQKAARLARKHGLTVVMNRCMKIEHRKLY